MQATLPRPFPDTTPATEFINGRLVQKMSPRGLHARVQAAVSRALLDWADQTGSGRVGSEWDFDLCLPGGAINRLVPDVAYLSYARVAFDDDASAEIPTVAPDVAVEILSPGQTMGDLAEKLDVYQKAGVGLTVVIDPRREVAVLHDVRGSTTLDRGGVLTHASLPGLLLPLADLFAKPGGGRRPTH